MSARIITCRYLVAILIFGNTTLSRAAPSFPSCTNVKDFINYTEAAGSSSRVDDNTYKIVIHPTKLKKDDNIIKFRLHENNTATISLIIDNITVSFVAHKIFVTEPEAADNGHNYFMIMIYSNSFMVRVDYNYSDNSYSTNIEIDEQKNAVCVQ